MNQFLAAVVPFLAAKYVVLYVYVLSALYIHFRGRARHKFFRQLTDHSTFMAPYNSFVYLFSAVPNTPMLNADDFPALQKVRDHWTTIRDEAVRLYSDGNIRAANKYNDLGFNSFFRTGWKRFYLKWYDDFLPSAKALCPRSVELLQSVPQIHAAMFALLPPGSRLVRHRDPFAGSLRYHLGLVTPNSQACNIQVDGVPYHWKDGEHVLFDQTFIHYAENNTETNRIILFCDYERPLRTRVAAGVNRFVSRRLVKASASQNFESERVGVLNKLFGYAYQVRLVGKRLKQFNRTLYYAVKYALIIGLAYLVFF